MQNIAVILAGGKGERLGFSKPKQFLKFAGKTCIEHCLDVFYANSQIDCIIIACNAEWMGFCSTLIKPYDKKKIFIIEGGENRNFSTFNALKFIESNLTKDSQNNLNLIIHDSARPLISSRILKDCIHYLSLYNALDVAVPAIDTIIKRNENNFIESIPKRDFLMYGQTPQCFKFELLKDAYNKAFKDNPKLDSFSDDCGLFLKYLPHIPIFVVKGEYSNHKLTRLEDIPLIDNLFMLKTMRLDSKINADLLKNKVIAIFGGSSGIGAEIIELAKSYGAKTYSFSRQNSCDISNFKDVKVALDSIIKKEKIIDLVINTAGILSKNKLIKTSNKDINNEININYKGNLNIAKAAFKHLEKSRGMLILTSSSSYSRGRENYCIYSSLKAAVVNLTQGLSEEWGDKVAINCIVPERTKTPMREANFGVEKSQDLLDPKYVAQKYLEIFSINANENMESKNVDSNTPFKHITGLILNVKKINW